jgi:hypothetical protein
MPVLNGELIALEEFEGEKARIYSVYIAEWDTTLFDRFLEEHEHFEDEIKSMVTRLELMAATFGVRDQWLKPDEGPPQNHVVALFDVPDSKLRCYAIQFGKVLLILGGGGEKPKTIRRFQESPKLTRENTMMQQVSEIIHSLLKNGQIQWSDDLMDLTGNLNFEIEVENE